MTAETVAAEAEQAARLFVEHRHPAVGVEGDDAFPDAVQGRLALLQQRRDLRQLQSERLALEPPDQQGRGDDPDREGDRGVGEDGGQQRQQPAWDGSTGCHGRR